VAVLDGYAETVDTGEYDAAAETVALEDG